MYLHNLHFDAPQHAQPAHPYFFLDWVKNRREENTLPNVQNIYKMRFVWLNPVALLKIAFLSISHFSIS